MIAAIPIDGSPAFPTTRSTIAENRQGPIDVAEDPLSDCEEPIATDADQVGVRLPITVASRLDEIAIHLPRPLSTLCGAPVRLYWGSV